LTIDYVSLITA